MFDQGAAVGFLPTPVFDLRAGHLYNVVISLLVFLGCAYAAWAIYNRGKKTLPESSFAAFLASIAAYWLVVAGGNLLAWLGLLPRAGWLAYAVKLLSVLPLVTLAYFLCSELFGSKTAIRRATFLYVLVAAFYVGNTIQHDLDQSLITYWGVQWQVSTSPLLIYVFALLFPLGLAAAFLILRNALSGVVEKKNINLTLHLGAVIFVILEYLQVSLAVVTWQRLILRLFYILIAFGAYLYFVARTGEKRFVPRDSEVPGRRMMRVSFFTKLLALFVLLAVVPITIASFLMFVSFKEIIDLYVYKPLLWNLKTSREAFIMTLDHVQIQALFLMLLTGLLVLLASVLVSRAISRSLRSVSLGMARVSDGDFSFKLLRTSNDEIGDVVEYFNEMSAEIKDSREIMEKWNRELETKVAERTEDLRTLYNVSKAIGSSLDFELLIGKAIDHLMPVLKADAYAVLVPGEKGRFSVRVRRGLEIRSVELVEGRGLAGEALQKNEILAAEDLAKDPRCQDDLYKGLGLKTLVAVPLRAKGKTQGLLLIGTRGEHAYSRAREINLLETIADQLAVAIENVGIYEREKEAVARLTELDRMKNEFISMVSHELRTPVTSVDGYVSLFLAGATGPITEDQKNYLTIVKENDQRLLTLINRLLDFSRIESGRFSIKRELASIHDIIHATVESLRNQLAKKKAELKLHLTARHVNFMGDKEKMTEVIINLVENALKFNRGDKPPRILIESRDAGDFIEVSVADNGIGLEPQHLEKIFNKFYQLEETMTRQAGGVGLGLAIAKEIVGDHRGKIWAESDGRDKGARFVFTIPMAERV
ncbi:ATP-binding protein [Candidatus Margulisiibacteriota bacterium]